MAIRWWILQLISHSQVFEVVYDKLKTQGAQPAMRALIAAMLLGIVHALPGCIFAIDGLDECSWSGENRRIYHDDSVARFLETIWQAVAGTDTRVMIVSRDEPEIRQFFHSYRDENVFEYKISAEDVRPDTKLYSKSVVYTKLAEKSESLKSDISRKNSRPL